MQPQRYSRNFTSRQEARGHCDALLAKGPSNRIEPSSPRLCTSSLSPVGELAPQTPGIEQLVGLSFLFKPHLRPRHLPLLNHILRTNQGQPKIPSLPGGRQIWQILLSVFFINALSGETQGKLICHFPELVSPHNIEPRSLLMEPSIDSRYLGRSRGHIFSERETLFQNLKCLRRTKGSRRAFRRLE